MGGDGRRAEHLVDTDHRLTVVHGDVHRFTHDLGELTADRAGEPGEVVRLHRSGRELHDAVGESIAASLVVLFDEPARLEGGEHAKDSRFVHADLCRELGHAGGASREYLQNRDRTVDRPNGVVSHAATVLYSATIGPPPAGQAPRSRLALSGVRRAAKGGAGH